MKWYIIALGAALILIGCFVAVMDSLQFHYSTSIPARKGWDAEFWNPDHSWRFKYERTQENVLVPAPDNIYYRWFDLKYKERYFLSATALSFTTDAWHLAKFFAWGLMRAIVVLLLIYILALHRKTIWGLNPLWYFVPLWLLLAAVQALGFHLIYSWL